MMKTPLLKMSSFAPLLAVGTLAVSQTASASDRFVYNIAGASCVGENSPSLVQYSHWGVNAMASQSGGSPTVTCPMPTDGAPWLGAAFEISGYNRNVTDPLSCTLIVTDWQGLVYSSTTLKLVTTTTAAQSQFVWVGFPSPDSGINNLFSISCHLPVPTASGFTHLTSVTVTKFEN
jgi:hypothetical protein